MIQAIVDLGTNTFNLLIVKLGGNGMSVLYSEERPVFLGKGGIEKNVIAEDAFSRGIEALRHFRTIADAHGASRVTGFGTSALRNASNAHAFVAQAERELNIPVQVIPGDEEAGLILDGVRQAVVFGKKPKLVMDIGGGSIEFILATDKALMWKRSFELGVTRLRERFPVSDPIALADQLRIGEHLDNHLEPLWSIMDRHWPDTLVGSAGSFDTLAAMIAAHRGITLSQEDTTLEFGHVEFCELKDGLMRASRADRLAMPGLPEHRVDTIAFALIAIDRLLAHGITTLQWSRYALKEGAASRMGRT